MTLRHLEERDYQSIIAILDDWWGGRRMAHLLPKIFFVHFRETSFALEDERSVVAFLCGFISQSYPAQAYIHFVGVHPDYRGKGIGRRLYKSFFEVVEHAAARPCVALLLLSTKHRSDSTPGWALPSKERRENAREFHA